MALKKTISFLPLLIILLIGFYCHWDSLTKYPEGAHAWAQSDRIALAQGYQNNGFDLFHPEALNYNAQFPTLWLVPNEQTTTAVDLPLFEYIVAACSSVTGFSVLSVFRIFLLFISGMGLFYLFKLLQLRTGSWEWSAMGVALFLFSPLFLKYQVNFLPSIPSLALAMIATYFCFKYLEDTYARNLIYAAIILMIATLMRTSFLVYFCALFGAVFLSEWKMSARRWFHFLVPAGAFLVIVLYAIWNSYLRTNFGSNFLSQLLPLTSFEQLTDWLDVVYRNWFLLYFSAIGWILLILFALFVVFHFRFLSSMVRWLLLLSFTGALAFVIAMGQQFVHHDYYFIDIGFPLMLPVVVAGLEVVSRFQWGRWWKYATVSSFVIFLAFFGFRWLKVEQSLPVDDPISVCIAAYYKSADFIRAHTQKEDRILVLGSHVPNAAFIGPNRKGYVVINDGPAELALAMSWKYDYIIVDHDHLREHIAEMFPTFCRLVQVVASDQRVVIFRKAKNAKFDSMTDLLNNYRSMHFTHESDLGDEDFWEIKPNAKDSSCTSEKFLLKWMHDLPTKGSVAAQVRIDMKELIDGLELQFFQFSGDEVLFFRSHQVDTSSLIQLIDFPSATNQGKWGFQLINMNQTHVCIKNAEVKWTVLSD